MYKAFGEQMIVTSGFEAQTISRALAYGLRERKGKPQPNIPIAHSRESWQLPPVYEEPQFMERVTRYGELVLEAEQTALAVRNLRAIAVGATVFRNIYPKQAAALLEIYDHSDPDAVPAGPFHLAPEELTTRITAYYPTEVEARATPLELPHIDDEAIKIYDARKRVA
ncbi:MAG TPA: hypothetical protein VN778_04540 [Verrucomicrobiae bacterium]|nr:hypothetical protein [Verrucomicrobiae bacterium]